MNVSVIYSDDNPQVLLVQPVDSHDMEEMEKEVEYIRAHSSIPFRLLALPVKRWNDELTPWQAPPVFGKTPFGDGAGKTLEEVIGIIGSVGSMDSVGSMGIMDSMGSIGAVGTTSCILGGYSLAGLFSLWAGTQYPFDGIVAASPSVWYKDWLDFSERHPMKAKHVYLSLGDKEHRSKTPIMATVDDCIRRQKDTLQRQGIDSVLEMNPGNHFQDNGVRTAKGFVWAMGSVVL